MRCRRLATFLVAAVCLGPVAVQAQETTSLNTRAGELERKAARLPWPNESPKRTRRVDPVYPDGVQGLTGLITLQATLDAEGRISEFRPLQFIALGSRRAGDDHKATAQAFVASATDAVKAWQYEAPAKGPVTFMMTVVIRPPSADGAAVAAPAEVHLKKDDPALKKIRDVAPKYPIQASRQRIQGVIVLDATVAPDGRVIDARILRAIPYLDQAALDAVAQWEFNPLPPLIDGERRNAVAELMVNFKQR